MQNIRLLQLDGLRGLFSLMVVIYHFPYENEFAQINLTSNFLVRQGDLFVDFFFVLSGFVISLNYIDRLDSGKSFGNYINARFIRLYPLLLYTSLIFLAFELTFNIFMPQMIAHPESVSELLLETADTLLFLNSTPALDVVGINFPSWSISSEMISYIIFGLVIVFAGKMSRYALLLIAVLSGILLLYTGMYMQTYTWGFVRGLVCFITGAFTLMAFRKYGSRGIGSYWEYIIPVMLVALLYVRYQHLQGSELFTLLTIPTFFGVAIYVYAVSGGPVVKVLSGRVFQYLGNISYSMYLNHAIVMIVISKTAFNVIKLPVTELNVTCVILAYIVCVILYSHITYNLIEKKGTKFLKQHGVFKNKNTVPAGDQNSDI
ncbi:acyltransferase family protein [Flavobacterium sp.]|uniref:acyltransferase family protein n=1 Tax=Flavobacterium sp. TaxID=239 RepID=UPI004033E9ED